jgi:glycosyltransferase involved in cell wall biosynthesis
MKILTCIIPAYNDESTIETVITETFGVGRMLHIPLSIIVINDASLDTTGAILKKLQRKYVHLTVITHKRNYGYGQTIKELYTIAKTPWLVSLPGDFQIHPNQIAKLWKNKATGDMIIGFRTNRQDSAARRLQSAIYNLLLRMLFGLRLHDANSIRLMKTSIMKHIHLSSTSAFVDAQLTIKTLDLGYKVKEVPIRHQARRFGRGGGGKLTTIIPTVRDMIACKLDIPLS